MAYCDSVHTAAAQRWARADAGIIFGVFIQ
jgi:hypothetical protein